MTGRVKALTSSATRAAGEIKSRFIGNPRGVAIAFLLLIIVLPAPPSRANEIPPLGLFGNDEVLWVFQRKPDQSGTLHLHFSFWLQRDIERGGFFRPHILGLRGAIAKAALRGSALHAIYRDGTHGRYNAQVFSRLPTSKPLRTLERNIPGNVVPIAIGSDDELSVLYALVTARQAKDIQQLKHEAIALEKREAIDDVLDDKNQQKQAVPALALTSDCAIIRYQDGQWHVDRNAPQNLALGSKVPALAGHEGEIHLLYEDASTPNAYSYCKSIKAAADWSSPSIISFDASLEYAILIPDDPSPRLIASLNTQSAIAISIYRLGENGWSLSSELSDNEGRVRRFARPVATSIFASELAIATQDADHEVSVGRWSLETGLPLEPAKVVHSLQTTRPTGPESRFHILIQYGILGGILTVVFLRRRESVTLVASIKKDQQLASFLHRFAAFLIDMTILFPIWGTLSYKIFSTVEAGRSGFERLAVGESISPNELLFWLTAIIGAIFGLYSIVFESISAATPGKRLLGLSVVSDQGERGRFMVILIRNLVRPIEFYFPPVALLVAVTPSRQRLGDLLARTVVVMPKDPVIGDDTSQDLDNDGQERRIDEQA